MMTDMTASQNRRPIAIGTHHKADRAAVAVLAVAGTALLATTLVLFAQVLPRFLGAEGEHAAGETWMVVVIILLPMTVGGLCYPR